MRNNGPVTKREVQMTDSMMIVSKTDDKGRIVSVNQDFVDMSGFTREELLNQPHNIIRHPDMPPEAFEDMWRDLKAGLPWSGYVKNRVKNGDHYWVQANAMPEIENGRITGFVSIRSKPEPAVVREVASIYKKFIEGKADGLSVEHGQVVSHAFKDRAKRWCAQLGNKVTMLSAALCAAVTLVGGVGIFVELHSNESLRTVYEDRTVPAGQLSTIQHNNYDSLIELYALAVTRQHPEEVVGIIEKNTADSEAEWKAYMATYLTPEEAALAKQFEEKNEALKTQMIVPALELIKAGQPEKIGDLLAKENEITDEVADINAKLLTLQMDVAKQEYQDAKQKGVIGLIATICVISVGIVLAYVASRWLKKYLAQRLKYVDGCLLSIANGNYKTEIELGADELQATLTSVRALRNKLAYAECEKADLERQKKMAQAKMADDFEQSVRGVVSVVAAAATELSQTAESLSHTVEESSSMATKASAAAETTSNNVQTVAAAAEELSASVKEISSQLQRTTVLVTDSTQKASNADHLAQELTNATNKVTSAMDMIATIAGQINLLALNATIESARAGDAGKGFAVVASEVKNLAGQTDKTVSEIQMVANEMREASQAIVVALSDISGSVGSISDAASGVASAVEEQTATTNEIAGSMQTAAGNTQMISENLHMVNKSSAQAGASSEQLLQASQELSRQAETLNSKVDDFLRRVRAA